MSNDEQEPEPYPPPCPPKLEQPVNGGNHMFMSPRNQRERDAWAAARWSIDNWTFPQIGEAMGISKSNAYYAVERGLRGRREAAEQTSENARNVHRLRLERAQEAAMAVLESTHITVSHGRVITIKDDNGNDVPLPDHGPILSAVDRVIRLSESLRKLDGLDAPAKVEHSGGVTYEIVGVDPQELQ